MSEIPTNQDKIRKGFAQQPNALYQPFITIYMRDVWQYINSCSKTFKPSKVTISKMTGLSKRKIDSVISDLEKHNMIKVKRSKDGRLHFTNGYELLSEKYWGGSAHGALGWCTPCTRGSAQDAPRVVHTVHPKNTKKNNNKNTNVEAPSVDNSKPPFSKKDFKDIFEFINQIHGWTSKHVSQCISRYYIRLLKKNEVGTINLVGKYAEAVRNKRQFNKSIRLRQGYPIFDTAFKKQFEEDLKNE